MSLTVALREELAHRGGDDPPAMPAGSSPQGGAGERAWRIAEAAAMLDLAGTLRLRGGDSGTTVAVVVRCAQGAVARRLRATLVDVLSHRPVLARQHGGNLRGGDAYLVEVQGDALHTFGVLDDDGRPARRDVAGVEPLAGYLAGALMVAGTLSGAGGAPHLEVRCPDEALAGALAGRLPGAGCSGSRVVVKSGEAISDLLARVGAHRTFLAFDQGRMRRDLRRQVTRSVNADRANLRRATAASAGHIAAIESLVVAHGWEGLPDDLADVALVRVANPEASLADLGQLLDPPVGKATVHRRLRRIMELASGEG